MAYEMNPDDSNYISEMIEEVTKYRPTRLDSAAAVGAMALWGHRMMALSNLAVANELAEIRKVLAARLAARND